MKSMLVIGMGRFGRHLSRKLAELDNEVMIVDRDENALQELLPIVTSAQIGDCTREDVLRSLGINNFDVCFVCIGSDFQSSLEVTALLKELGAVKVISKAGRDIQAKFLLRNGADVVIYPEREAAENLAVQYSANNLFDYFELTPEVGIYEIPVNRAWVDKSIREVNFRVRYSASILATKKGDLIAPLPPADHIFKADEHLMVLGRQKDIDKLLR